MGTTQKNIIRDKHSKPGSRVGKQAVTKGSKIPPQQEKNERIKELIKKAQGK